MQNWAGNHTFRAAKIETPETIESLQAIVRREPKIRAVGTRHCFNDIADSPGGTMILLAKFNRVLAINETRRQVTTEAGITYGQLAPPLHARGLALANLASLPHISVAGAVATGTHGSGETHGNLATAVAAMELMTADGDIRTLRRGEPDFDGTVVHLGCLGIVTQLTLDCVPTFSIAQTVYQNTPMDQFVQNLDAIVGSAYSVSAFTDWQSDAVNQVWMKSLPDVPHFDLTTIGGTRATRQLHPIDGRVDPGLKGIDPTKCTDQLGVPGEWHARLPHFKLEFTPSSGEELQSEYFVPRDRAVEAYAAVAALREAIRPLIQICELRFIKADNLWLSGCFGRDTAAIHFTWKRDQPAVDALLQTLEAALEPFDARPHWGKRFISSPKSLRSLYPKLDDFVRLSAQFDPMRRFGNEFARRIGVS